MRRALALTLLLAGCTHYVRIENPYHRPLDRHRFWVHGFLWNFIGGRIQTTAACGDRPIAIVETRKSIGNYLISWLTLGIYTPMQVLITCSEARPQYLGYPSGPATGPVIINTAPVYGSPSPAPYAQPPQPQPSSPSPPRPRTPATAATQTQLQRREWTDLTSKPRTSSLP